MNNITILIICSFICLLSSGCFQTAELAGLPDIVDPVNHPGHIAIQVKGTF